MEWSKRALVHSLALLNKITITSFVLLPFSYTTVSCHAFCLAIHIQSIQFGDFFICAVSNFVFIGIFRTFFYQNRYYRYYFNNQKLLHHVYFSRSFFSRFFSLALLFTKRQYYYICSHFALHFRNWFSSNDVHCYCVLGCHIIYEKKKNEKTNFVRHSWNSLVR